MNTDTRALFARFASRFATAKILVWEANHCCPGTRRSWKAEGKHLMNRARRDLDRVLIREALHSMEQDLDPEDWEDWDEEPFSVYDLIDTLQEQFQGGDFSPNGQVRWLAEQSLQEEDYRSEAAVALAVEVLAWCDGYREVDSVVLAIEVTIDWWVQEDTRRFDAEMEYYSRMAS